MTNKSKYELLINNTLLISIGTFGSKILTFLMTRFYTEALTPSDYGEADLIIQTANLLIPLVSAGIADGLMLSFSVRSVHTRRRQDPSVRISGSAQHSIGHSFQHTLSLSL